MYLHSLEAITWCCLHAIHPTCHFPTAHEATDARVLALPVVWDHPLVVGGAHPVATRGPPDALPDGMVAEGYLAAALTRLEVIIDPSRECDKGTCVLRECGARYAKLRG